MGNKSHDPSDPLVLTRPEEPDTDNMADQDNQDIDKEGRNDKNMHYERPRRSGYSYIVIIVTWIFRILCGGLFIFSGFVKAVDPWGTLFKIEEYLNAFGFELPFALLRLVVFGLCTFEFFIGCFLLLGCFRKSCPVFACLVMAFMLPFTLWIAMENPVADCGCFGDAVIISNWATFWKNVVLTIGVVWLIRYNISVFCLITPAFQWLAIVATGIFIMLIEIIGFFEQPLIDFRDYKIGSELFSNETSEDDHGIDIYDLETLDDKNEEALEKEGKELVVMIPKVSMISPASTWKLNSLYQWSQANGVKMIGVVSGSAEDIENWEDLSMTAYPVYLADDSEIKEVVRGNPGIVYLDNGKIIWKTTLNAIDVEDFMSPEVSHDALTFETDRGEVLRNLIFIYLIIIGILILISFTPRLARMLIRVGFASKRGIRHH